VVILKRKRTNCRVSSWEATGPGVGPAEPEACSFNRQSTANSDRSNVYEQVQGSERVATLKRLVGTLEKEVVLQNKEAFALRERLDKEQAKVAKLE
jgi:hypothetical protein